MGTCSPSSDENEEEEEGTVWEYEDDNKLWMLMDVSVTKTIQQAHNSNKKLLHITSNYGFKYKIDFKKMTQTNTTSGKSRNIRQNRKHISTETALNQNADIPVPRNKTEDIGVDSSTDQMEDIIDDSDEDGDFMDQFQATSTGKNISNFKYDYTEYKEDEKTWNKTKIYYQPVGLSRNETRDDSKSTVSLSHSENDDTTLFDDVSNDKKSANIPVSRWQWCDDGRIWKDYDSVKNAAIADAHKNGENIYLFSFGGKKYEVRLDELKQYNVKTKFARKIRRVQADKVQSVDTSNIRRPIKKHFSVKPVSAVQCWQWQDDDGYKDYSQVICNELESVYINQGADGYGKLITKTFGTQSYDIKPFQMVQVNKATQYTRAIRRVHINDKTDEKFEKFMKWQWCDDGPEWRDYSTKISIAIEKSYANSENIHQLTIKSKTYEIRFGKLKQRNLSSNFERDVRRVAVNNNAKNDVRNRSDDNFVRSESWTGPKRKTFGDEVKTLYHVTNKTAAAAIGKSGRMIRGSDGMFGGGIYFAENVESAIYKSEHKGGWVITAKVLVGKTFVAKDASAGKFDFNKLQSIGCDSVHAPNGSGKGKSERVVFNWDQVCVVSVNAHILH